MIRDSGERVLLLLAATTRCECEASGVPCCYSQSRRIFCLRCSFSERSGRGGREASVCVSDPPHSQTPTDDTREHRVMLACVVKSVRQARGQAHTTHAYIKRQLKSSCCYHITSCFRNQNYWTLDGVSRFLNGC